MICAVHCQHAPHSLRSPTVRTRPWHWSALAGALVIAAAVVSWFQYRIRPLGTPAVTPPPGRVSMKVGDVTVFTASAEAARRVTWSVWSRPMSHAAQWSYVPGPEDAGWQQISVEILGDGGQRAVRTWDIGVVPAVAPELTDVSPPPGVVAIPAGQSASFRATARVPAARAEDRLSFEWSVDGRLAVREERSAERGASEFAVPATDPGSHRVVVRVSEGKRSASLAEWALDVAPAASSKVAVAPRPEAAPPVQPPTAVPPAPRVVRSSGPRSMTVDAGDSVSLSVAVDPPDAGTAFQWSVDGKRVATATKPSFDYVPGTPGRHRVSVSVVFGERSIGGDAWFVRRGEPEELAEATPMTSSTAPVPPSREEPTTQRPVELPPVERVPTPTEPLPAETIPSTATTMVPVVADTIPPSEPEVVARATSGLESDVRAWLGEYARAWSRKDVATLRSMGQVRTSSEADQLEHYFRSVGDLHVDVRVLSVTVAGDRASVEFERTDTVTDPSGRKQELRLPAIRKEVERTPDGLRFTVAEGRG